MKPVAALAVTVVGANADRNAKIDKNWGFLAPFFVLWRILYKFASVYKPKSIDMKKFLIPILTAAMLSSCNVKEAEEPITQWEYQVISIPGLTHPQLMAPHMADYYESIKDYKPLYFVDRNNFESVLNGNGEMGWELVGVHTTIETVSPEKGLNNTRTQTINLIFKRPKKK